MTLAALGQVRTTMLSRCTGSCSLACGEGRYFLVFVPTIREIRDFSREKYGTDRESVTLQGSAGRRLRDAADNYKFRRGQRGGAVLATLLTGLLCLTAVPRSNRADSATGIRIFDMF
eukprot:SAG31_NODE_835_length_11646_cov_11.142201_6_plen_117_part_00